MESISRNLPEVIPASRTHAIIPAQIEAYEALVGEVDAIRVETVYNASQVILEGKLTIGKLLLEQKLDIPITELIQYVATDTKINERDLWYCYKFAENEKKIEALPEYQTKVISWNRVKKMLADPEKAKSKCGHKHTETMKVCVDCGARLKDIHTAK
jgi:hypothetical protein